MNQEAISRALACGEFAKAQRLWGEYAEDLRQAIVHGTVRPAAIAEAGQLLESARWSVKAFRAQAEAQLAEARAAAQYLRVRAMG